MARLPVVASDNDTWGGLLNDFLDSTLQHSTLNGGSSAGASSITVAHVPPGWSTTTGFVVIEPYTNNCEIRRVSGIAGNVLTLAAGQTVGAATNIGFVSGTKRITSTAESVSKFFPGARITVSGSASNNGTYTVAGYPADGSYDGTYITTNEALVTEAAGASVTITMNLNRAHADGSVVIFSEGPVPVTWYGAKPSGSTGDAATNRLGIQRCADDGYWAGFNDIYFPGFLAGRYYIDAPLYMEKLQHWHSPHQKSGVIAAHTTFVGWNDDIAMIQTRRNGMPCRFANGGNDRYYITGLGIDGLNVAHAKSTGYSGSSDAGTALVTTATNTVSVHATLSAVASVDHGHIIYRALAAGTGGNSIRVAHLGGISQTLAVSVSGNDITVQLGTNGSGVVTSTASAVIAAVNAHGGASALVNASLRWAGELMMNSGGTATTPVNDGSGIPNVFALTTLTAGTAPFAAGDVGRSIYLGLRGGVRTITAFTNSSTVTVSGAAFSSTRAGVRFAVSPVNGFLGSFNQTAVLRDMRIESCPGYAFASTGSQEFTVSNLMTLFCGIHRRLFGAQFAHFYDCNMEHTCDAYVTFETDALNNINRSNTFHNGHIEDIAPCDYWRAEGTRVCESFTIDGAWQSTSYGATAVVRLESTLPNAPSYGIINWAWSGPNFGPMLVADSKRGYTVPMTAFVDAASSNFTCDHWFVRRGMIQTSRNILSKSAAYTMLPTDKLILCTANTFTVTLPAGGAAAFEGMVFSVQNTGAGTITFNGTAVAAGAGLSVVSNGTSWVNI